MKTQMKFSCKRSVQMSYHSPPGLLKKSKSSAKTNIFCRKFMLVFFFNDREFSSCEFASTPRSFRNCDKTGRTKFKIFDKQSTSSSVSNTITSCKMYINVSISIETWKKQNNDNIDDNANIHLQVELIKTFTVINCVQHSIHLSNI